jgi:hypothetical protein
MTDVLLTVGTRKGLFIGRRRGGTWEFDGPHFNAQAVYSIGIDTRRSVPRLLVGGDSAHWGPSVFHSDDLGKTWIEPEQPAVKFPKDTGASLERVWQLHPAGPAAPDVVYAGTEPAALFRSDDRGETFELVRPLWEHPTRSKWEPGGGGEAVHTVVTDRRDPQAVTVAVSAAGVFRSKDGGASWAPSNQGVSAVVLPDPNPEFGQCVHKIAQDAGDLDRLYLQNHWGVYRSDDAGAKWTDIGEGLPSDFGFAIAAHPPRPDNGGRGPGAGRTSLSHLPYERRGRQLGGPVGRAARGRPLRHRAAGRAAHGRRGPGRCVLRQSQRRGVCER